MLIHQHNQSLDNLICIMFRHVTASVQTRGVQTCQDNLISLLSRHPAAHVQIRGCLDILKQVSGPPVRHAAIHVQTFSNKSICHNMQYKSCYLMNFGKAEGFQQSLTAMFCLPVISCSYLELKIYERQYFLGLFDTYSRQTYNEHTWELLLFCKSPMLHQT